MRFLFAAAIFLISCSDGSQFNGVVPSIRKPKTVSAAPEGGVVNQKSSSNGEAVQVASAQSAPEAVPEKLFNVAILTQSVQCLFCHMKIEGDVGGIDFPRNKKMHSRSGEGLRILGTLFSTNEVPNKLGSAPHAAATRPYYENTELKIFPTTKNSSGDIVFPTVTEELLKGKTKGTLKSSTVSVTDFHDGNLVLVGQVAPIEVSGEVYIDGDLVIGGSYRGVGTIYAKNIFIVKDLKGIQTPYPFPSDPDLAKSTAKDAIAAQFDGLYLFSLGQITVGYPDPAFLDNTGWKRADIPRNPNTNQVPSGLSLEQYQSYAEPKGCSVNNGHSKIYRRVLVNQVDAFLYSSDYLLWRTCNNFELNGGFVAPNVALVNAGDADAGRDSEPDNVVRYDYRLRAGVKAFSLLKNFFEQQ